MIRQVKPTSIVTSSNQDERFLKILQGQGDCLRFNKNLSTAVVLFNVQFFKQRGYICHIM